jgi:hypothetical protein
LEIVELTYRLEDASTSTDDIENQKDQTEEEEEDDEEEDGDEEEDDEDEEDDDMPKWDGYVFLQSLESQRSLIPNKISLAECLALPSSDQLLVLLDPPVGRTYMHPKTSEGVDALVSWLHIAQISIPSLYLSTHIS